MAVMAVAENLQAEGMCFDIFRSGSSTLLTWKSSCFCRVDFDAWQA